MITSSELGTLIGIIADRPIIHGRIPGEVKVTYESKHPKYKIQIQIHHVKRNFFADLIFEQRPGVWYRLGDFPDTPEYEEALKFFGSQQASVRTDIGLYTSGDVAEFLQQVLK